MAEVDITEFDRAALELAIAHTLAEKDRSCVEQVRSMLADTPRLEVARFCAYHRQREMLRLKPWEAAPCWIRDIDKALRIPPSMDTCRRRDAAQLLRRMLDLGISQFHPDPMSATRAAEAMENAGQ